MLIKEVFTKCINDNGDRIQGFASKYTLMSKKGKRSKQLHAPKVNMKPT